jgi:hypothetical protein
MSEKINEELKYTPNMCPLDRSRRKKYKGRGYKKCGTTRTDETRV